jgi:hypothetical protein
LGGALNKLPSTRLNSVAFVGSTDFAMTEPSSKSGGFFAVNVSKGTTTLYRDGGAVGVYDAPIQGPSPNIKLRGFSNANRLVGPKLKIERAKCHIRELEAAYQAFSYPNPYNLIREVDPNTGENVYRIIVQKDIPIELSTVIGDIVHNLRAVLDYVACDLIRANGDADTTNRGLPIDKRAKRLKPGTVSKIQGVSPKAERLILRLKACDRWNVPMWCLHWLDILDKHNCIVPAAAAVIRIQAKVGVPGMFVGPDGNIRLLGPGPDGKPLLVDAGTPTQFRQIFPVKNNIEVYRSPAGFQEDVQVAVGIAFHQTGVAEGEPVIETLTQLAKVVERTIEIVERSAF